MADKKLVALLIVLPPKQNIALYFTALKSILMPSNFKANEITDYFL